MAAQNSGGELGLSIIGLASQYPPYALKADALETLSKRFYPESPSMQKVLAINRFTGIDTRSSIGTPDHPLVNQERAPSIAELHKIFLSDGVPLAVTAAQKAISEARIDLTQITHIVSTTCTDSGNPGYDHYVAKGLGITHQVEKVLLHGIGCSGGLAALRTAANLALGHALRRKPARILVIALEVSTTMVRSELDSVNELQETRIGAALFSDCASALVLSNGLGDSAESVYDLLAWDHRIIPDTEEDLGFDADPVGWKVVLSPRVPKLTAAVLPTTFTEFMASIPPLPPAYKAAADFDWAMHPGGATILTGAEKAMGITPEHMRASYDTYINHGNSSSATVFSVIDRLRAKDMDAYAPGGNPKEYVVGCGFGPGIAVEMCMLKRNMGVTGLQTPPETESEASRSEAGEDAPVGSGETVPGVEVPSGRPFVEKALSGHDSAAAGTGVCIPGLANERSHDDAFISEALAGVELD